MLGFIRFRISMSRPDKLMISMKLKKVFEEDDDLKKKVNEEPYRSNF